MRFLTKVADMMILNIIFLVTSIPLITIGASLTALHYVTLRMAAGEEGPVVKDYLRSFRRNFRQATIIWLILMVFLCVLTYDIRLTWNAGGYISIVVKVMSVIGSAGLVMILLYVFGVLAKFDNTVKGTLRNAAAISIAAFPKTLSMFMLIAASAALTFYTELTVRWGLLFWLTIGFSMITYFNSILLKKTFDKLIEESFFDK